MGTPRAGEIAAKAKSLGYEVVEVKMTGPEPMSAATKFVITVIITLVALMSYVAVRSH